MLDLDTYPDIYLERNLPILRNWVTKRKDTETGIQARQDLVQGRPE